ncbi:hypothetical protein [Streptomyces bambusae]|uniref:Uncharacterized protein n=1 Tax=Streptomyces bambusae TaxID=1550616 RepID=A0ABS6Z3C8_9ACTN|nr:hypothetical protein [Streptomyces bambusae]MBW5482247.1 hypothetical protein [Streptomyces bambusae]
MTTRDDLLIDLINRTEMNGEGPRITVATEGVVITGRLTPHRRWAADLADRLSEAGLPDERFAEDFAREAGEIPDYPPAFLNLRGCQLISGTSSLPTALGEYFRIPLSAVSAWSVR